MEPRQAPLGSLGPDQIFISASLIRWKLEVGRVGEDAK